MKFKLKSGRHAVRTKRKTARYVKGDVVESDTDLVARFGSKFERLLEDVPATKPASVGENAVSARAAEKTEDADTEETSAIVSNDEVSDADTEEDTEDSSDAEDEEDTEEGPIRVRVERKGSRFNLYRVDDDGEEEKLNEGKMLSKDRKDAMIETLGNVELVEE